jgi:hypothetical protein
VSSDGASGSIPPFALWPSGGSRDFLWRRGRRAIRLSRGHDLGSAGRHAGGPHHGTAFWTPSDFGSERPRGPALYGGEGQAPCGALRPILEALDAQRLLIVDGHPVHKLRLFDLPPYSPELNPDEPAGNPVKQQGVGRALREGAEHLKKHVVSHLRRLQQSPDSFSCRRRSMQQRSSFMSTYFRPD